MTPRGFSDLELEQIKKKLMTAARDYFQRVGLKKTSIKELTEAANIAQGSFYKFFPSKEVLYFKLIEQDEHEIHQQLNQAFANINEINAASFSEMIQQAIQLIDAYPLVKQTLFSGQLEELIRHLPDQAIQEHLQHDTLSFAPMFTQWQAEGKLRRDITVDVAIASLRAVILMLAHKQEVGAAVFDDVIKLLVSGLAERIFVQ
ncbi:TetR/AcrR family transcriptional regulator [Amphibacillus sediminis]|uniref:TetR/AcrR family transcriptional regulator n=1 Tax=Amphibacillus sediminis TaxID=360185 RepID=UPI00082E7D7A|nr:TetR/AcrR family transcriptional regulator [Amphibacillus sediminis]